jgi:GGDEF domain-containing protein
VLTEFQVALRREFARASRYRQPLSLLLGDLPATSDALGKVRDAVRLCDSAVTAPGERIAVILPETPLEGALLVATRLAGALGPSPATGGPQSFGVATYPSSAVTDADGLLRGAQKAMETARSRGGGILTADSRG